MAVLPVAADPTTVPRRRRLRRPSLGRTAAWVFMIASLLATLFPFYWMLRTALSNTRSLASNADSFLPADITLGAFERVLGLSTQAEAIAQGGSGASVNFWLYLKNSLIVATTTTVGQVFFCAMAAYAFARLTWPGRDKLFFAFITALMIPPIFTTLPNFVLIKDLGLLNTYLGIVLPGLLMTPFAVFFLRQFFLGIPREIEEAAMIDGAGRFRVFLTIILPMSSAPISTLALLTYITSWNDYFWPLLVGKEESVRVLTVALGIFRSQTPQGSPDWAGLMAATLIAALPILILYLVLGRKIINSIGFSGIK
ncbi:carbohydrate ABC transporter permease [Actinotalea sp. K2]|uniref:carbohydrate ABC transporter permease n=1 Tax=Actinotalea sp. K2 TaxID=2939438 RepID=UPI002016EB15|nr:carbohydrate ABC transporter permease [Actinotalea sp. K2]MCL3859763.1 carbohydrate ABC transporter permease [Actinotalea sp. K2]